MIKPHIETLIVTEGVAMAMLPEGIILNAIASLQEFIALRPNAREVRKALFC